MLHSNKDVFITVFLLQSRELSLPSPTYIKAYLESFCHGRLIPLN